MKMKMENEINFNTSCLVGSRHLHRQLDTSHGTVTSSMPGQHPGGIRRDTDPARTGKRKAGRAFWRG
jgi:hypothetical protein